jgi:signal transduction histidine kinase
MREKGLPLSVDMPDSGLPMVGDRSKVERIFQNVFNNAVKFTVRGEIRVKAGLTEDQARIVLEVSDTGMGIEKGKVDSIFEPFQQADNSLQKAFSGLGLGLTVAKRMAELVGAKLEISSELDTGTTVVMNFPAQGAQASVLISEQRRYG